MKHVYLLLYCLLLSGAAMAQRPLVATAAAPGVPPVQAACAEPVSGFQAHADSSFLPLDKSQIPTGLLYDRVFPTGQPGIH
ncbi:hypothetical protein [Hymenobacter psychrotolerans]|uniref:Uncharacterized protein n=1 Tax=Hymenobacter psychrotolerans DSM 18569 TaxID=1121959 RepID=A0A1M7HGT1_9BACT|nr:hypothetical protein [Hymenobacter psychrotolerans]SHM27692.1 hypothetical protein SAMN02746009_04229 [Hymenobacter psychrotolerans DSM 18569]